jgi:transposase InsO family protein
LALTNRVTPVGLSAILLQKSSGKDDRRVVAYASRSLSDVETRYSQTEKEALAIVWAIERLHLYLYGKKFTLITDCKPVQLIFGNPKSRPPARIERWNLRLQCYDFEIVHMEGNHNPSDFLSRHVSNRDDSLHDKMAEDYVNFLCTEAVPKAMTLTEIQTSTSEDVTLQCLIDIIRNQSWNKIDTQSEDLDGADLAELKRFKQVKDELTVNSESNVILRNGLIVVPASLRHKAVAIAHEGHQGLVKTKKLLREKVWFPGLDTMTKDAIDSCLACQANGPENRPDPLQMSPLPPSPWHTVHMDFCGPFPTGDYLFVVIDAYSRFPEVEIVSSTSAATVIPKLDKIFSVHGVPHVVRSDNGPPFNSATIKQYMSDNGIEHRRITPLWPQANSEAEIFMKPLTKAIRSANVEGKSWKKYLYQFLLNYRTTPHTTTGFPPAELLFNRKIRNKLPQLVKENDDKKTDMEAIVQNKDAKAKRKMKQYTDARLRAKSSKLEVGDQVLAKQRKTNKLTTRFDPHPFRIIRMKGTMITATRNGKYITRNISYFKKFDQPEKDRKRDESDSQINSEDDDDLLLSDSERETNTARRYPQRNRANVQRYGQNIYDC